MSELQLPPGFIKIESVDTPKGKVHIDPTISPAERAAILSAMGGTPQPQPIVQMPAGYQLVSPQDVAVKTSSTGFAPAQPQSSLQVMETLNAPFDYAGDVAGRAVQNLVDPVKNPNLSDVAGGLTKAAVQYFGPQGVVSGVKGAAKGLMSTAPGSQGGKIESLIGKTQGVMESGLSRAQKSQAGFERVVNKIQPGDSAPLTKTLQTADDIIAYHKSHGIESSPVLTDAKRIKNVVEGRRGAADLKWIDAELTDIGEKTKTVMGQKADPRYKQLFAALANDLESTKSASKGVIQSSTPTFQKVGGETKYDRFVQPSTDTELKQVYEGGPLTAMPARGRTVQTQEFKTPEAQMTGFVNPTLTEDVVKPSGAGVVIRAKDQAVRRTKGFEDLIDEFNNLVKTKRGQAGAQDINANQLMDKLKKNEFLTESLRPEDWEEVTPLLAKLADTAALPAARGVSYGSGRALSRGAVAGGIASMTGMDPFTTAGAITAIDYATGHLLMTKSGRSMVKAVLEMKAYSPSQKLNIINGMGLLAEKGINKAME